MGHSRCAAAARSLTRTPLRRALIVANCSGACCIDARANRAAPASGPVLGYGPWINCCRIDLSWIAWSAKFDTTIILAAGPRARTVRGELFKPEAHTLLFVLSVLAIVPLAALLSRATESVAARTGDTIGGLLNATLGNLTELLIALAALRAGQYVLVKATIVGAIVANSLFMLGASFLIGGLKHHVQTYNRNNARLQAGMLFLATIALLIPSILAETDPSPAGYH
jgi:hypothetical protein